MGILTDFLNREGRHVRVYVYATHGKDLVSFEGYILDEDDNGIILEVESQIIIDNKPKKNVRVYYIPITSIELIELLDASSDVEELQDNP